MRNLIVLLLTLASAAGCASTSVPISSFPAENQEERVQKLLVGTWNGYVKDTRYARIENNDLTLEIYKVRKEQNGWTIGATINWRSPEYIKLNIYNDTVTIEMMDRYGGLYTLTPYQNHLLGHLGYDRGKWPTISHHDVVLEKVSR